jgi:hypothetical protein
MSEMRQVLEFALFMCMGLVAVKDILFLVMHILRELKHLLKAIGEVIQEAIEQWHGIQSRWSKA